MNIDAVIIIIYLLIILFIGLVSSRRLNTIDDFAVSNVKYGKTVIFITMCCSFLGGGFSFGNAAEVYKNGIGNIFALFGFGVGQILIGKYIATKMGRFEGCISTGNIMEKMYGKRMQVITGVLATIICSGILGAQVSVMGNIFYAFMGIPPVIGVIIGFGIVLIYSTMGGIKADIITDIIQFGILIIGIPFLVIYGIHAAGGITNLLTSVPKEYFNIFNNSSIGSFLSVFFTLMIGEMLVPPYVQRLLIGKKAQDTSKATIMSGFASFIFFIMTGLVGLISYSIDKNMIPEMAMIGIIRKVLPVGLSGVIISAMMAIVLSTADSFLNSAAVSVINDVYLPLKQGNVGQKEKLKIVRIANIIIGVIAVLVALLVPRLLDILTLSYSFWAPTLLPILLLSILGLNLSKKAVWIGMISGIGSSVHWNLILNKPYGIDGLIIGFVTNMIITVLLHFSKKVIYVKINSET